MQTFFINIWTFWYAFIYLFIICGLVTATIQCHFILHFSQVEPKVLFYLQYQILFLGVSAVELQFNIPPLLSTGIGIAIVYVFTHYLLKISRIWSLITALFVTTIDAMTEGIGAPVINMLSRLYPLRSLYLGLNIFCSMAVMGIAYLTYQYVLKQFRVNWKERKQYLPVIAVPLILIVLFIRLMLQFGYTGQVIMDENGIRNHSLFSDYQMLAISILAFVCLFISLLAYQKIMVYFEVDKKKALLEQQLSVQQGYTHEAKLRYDMTQTFRHDLNNHLIVLKGLIENGQREHATTYLDSFQKATQQLEFQINTGSAALDILLFEKFGIARQSGIEVCCDVNIPKVIDINEFDLCIIFSNAIDNAIKACDYMEEGNRWIDMKAKRNNNFFLIDIMNSYNKTANGNHGTGIGLPNIRMIADKYHGTIEISKSENTFILTVLLLLSRTDPA